MTKTQIQQFNRMRNTLRRIAKEYATPDQLRRTHGQFGLDYQETLEAAHENIQSDAAAAVRGVRELSTTTDARPMQSRNQQNQKHIMPPTNYQARVRAEKAELDEKIEKLNGFIEGGFAEGVSDNEKERLRDQRQVMREYSDILTERIENFPTIETANAPLGGEQAGQAQSEQAAPPATSDSDGGGDARS